jgi:hypothetical protein
MNELINDITKLLTEDKEQIEEGFLGDIFTATKVSKDLLALGMKAQKSLNMKDPDSAKSVVKSIINDGLKIIDKSSLSSDMKQSMSDSYLGGVFGQLKTLAPKLTGDEVAKVFEIPNGIYRRMVTAHIQQQR